MLYTNNDIRKILKGSLFVTISLSILYACANPGTPTGGPIDVTPPKVIGSTPTENAIGNQKGKIIINFDEYIKLDKPNEKVVVSPPQLQQPEIKTIGKKISINLLDSLKSNTTYTIDFSDAIQDNNEGNPMGNYTFTFSTGTAIDTMEVSGTVLNAADLEPIKGILVGLHSNLNDSAFSKTPFDRVGRTDSRGHFAIKGVARGKYHIYALADADQNFFFSQRSEQLAFNNDLIIPTCNQQTRQDTAWVDSITVDTIIPKPYTHFIPDNIILRAFKENINRHSLKKKERLIPQKFTLTFSAPNKDLPKIKGLNFNEKDAFIIDTDDKKDSITYWVKDSVNYKKDTLSLALSYMGHKAGWIALYSGMAGGGDVILLPELPYSVEHIRDTILHRIECGKRFSIVVVAEGVKNPGEGRPSEYIARMIEETTNIETRVTVLGYIQRGGSPTPFDRNLSTRMGGYATEMIAKGEFGKMVVYRGNEISSVPLSEVAGKLKLVTEYNDLVIEGKHMGICFG